MATKKLVKPTEKQLESVKKARTPRKYLTAVTIVAGVITLIDENGELKQYRQRGINTLPDEFKSALIGMGFLNRNWYQYKELPKEVTISFEDEEIMGKASATFPAKKAALILGRKS